MGQRKTKVTAQTPIDDAPARRAPMKVAKKPAETVKRVVGRRPIEAVPLPAPPPPKPVVKSRPVLDPKMVLAENEQFQSLALAIHLMATYFSRVGVHTCEGPPDTCAGCVTMRRVNRELSKMIEFGVSR